MVEVEYTRSYYAQLIPQPAVDANKFSRGSVAVIAGSAQYPGAAILAALSTASARCGAGYTTLITPHSVTPAAQAHLISIPVVGVDEVDGAFCLASVEAVKQASKKAKSLVIGCGIGRSEETGAFLRAILQDETRPVVIDADALWFKDVLMQSKTDAPRIYTPHEGEAARMLNRRRVEDRVIAAFELADCYHGTAVLKGPETLIYTLQNDLVVSRNAGPELAKAGSGDVLAGMVGAFLAQRLAAHEAAALAVYAHGEAGKVAAQKKGVVSVMAEDLVDSIPQALLSIQDVINDGNK